jgi:SAM-dependent methyltransferase
VSTCPLCGGTDSRPFLSAKGVRVAKCRCGFAYATWAEPEPYGEDYYRRWGAGTAREAALAAMKRRNFGLLLDLVAGTGLAGGALLDVGCGMGYSVDEALARGWNARGIETSSYAAAEGARRTGGRVACGLLEAQKFEAARFDVATLIDVIEHVADPLGLLNEIARITRPGGLIALTTPDLSSVMMTALGSRCPYVIPEHIGYFDRGTMARAMAETGWQVRRIGPLRKFLRVDYVRDIFASRGDAIGRIAAAALAMLPGGMDVGVCGGDMVVVAEKTRGITEEAQRTQQIRGGTLGRRGGDEPKGVPS